MIPGSRGRSPERPGARRLHEWLCLASFACCLSGCALVPKFGPPPQVGPPYIPPPEPVWVVLDPALFRAAADTGAAPRSSARTPVRSRPSDARATEPAGTETGEGPVALPGAETPGGIVSSSTWPETTAALARSLSVDLPASDRVQLEGAARRNLAAADSLARGASRLPLGPRDVEKLENARGLVRQAREALGRGDLGAAANLAYKARLLAGEVVR